MKHLVIVDGMGFLFRAYHAVRGNLTRADGMPTNALFGFAQMLVKVVDDLRPDECVVALDSRPPNWRHEIYAEYKANRPPPEPAMAAQLPFVEPLVRAFGLPVMRLDGVEADDIIATLVKNHSADRVTIVTSDKDLLQLVGEKVKLLDTLKEKWSGVEEAVEKFGVVPELVVEVQGLMGDSSDNIPGVPGVGPKTAGELVKRFGKLEDLYARIGEVERENLRLKLLENKDKAFLSRKLASLKDDVVLPELDIGFHPALHQACDYLRGELEFNSLAARLEKRRFAESADKVGVSGAGYRQKAVFPGQPGGTEGQDVATGAGKAGSQEPGSQVAGDGAQGTGHRTQDGWGGYVAVTTMEEWRRWMDEVRRVGVVAFDTETTSLDPYEARLVGISLCVGAGKACYVPVKGSQEPGSQVARGQGDLFGGGAEETVGPHGVEGLDILEDIRALLADEGVRKVAHNFKYDWLVVARALGVIPDQTGEALQGLVRNFEDTMLMSACLDGGRWGHGLDDSAVRHLGHAMIKYEEVCGKGKAQVTFDKVALDAATDYAAEDADATWRLWEVFRPRLAENGSQEPGSQVARLRDSGVSGYGPGFVYEHIEKPLLPVLVAMEARGVTVDVDELRRLADDFAVRMKAFEGEIWQLAGHEFNVQSTQQLAVVLFDELGVGNEKQKKARSTGVGVLEEIIEGSQGLRVSGSQEVAGRGAALARKILDYRQLAKLRSTYAVALLEERSAVTGRVHTNYMQMGAATGRFASSEPNLQNIPIRTEEGRKIRRCFVPKTGSLEPGSQVARGTAAPSGGKWVMVSADYSQIELRLLAHFSGSEALRKAFIDGVDVHAYTASLIYGVPMSAVTKDQRRAAKVINFGLVYGMGARSMAAGIGVSVQEASAWIDAYFRRYEGVKEYMEMNKRIAHEKGYVETLFGRRVWLPEINGTNGMMRAGAERAAINAPLQGSNADIIKLAMVAVEGSLEPGSQVARGPSAQMLMQVHDELVLECEEGAVEALREMLPRVMGGVVQLSVPLAVEVGVGANWDAAH